MKEAIHTDRAPAAIGPYSQAVRAGGFLFTSGQIPVDPAAGDIPAGIKAQAQQSLNNIAAILAQAGEVWAFPGTKPGTHKTRQAVWKDVKRAAKAFRLPQNIGTHSFRKVYAVRLREKYGSIAKVQRALAHSSLAVTAVYAMADALLSDSQQRRERQRAQRRTVET